MKKFEFEIDETKGFDLISAKDNRLIAHVESYEEAVSKLEGHSSWYIRYFMKKETSTESNDHCETPKKKTTRKAA